MKHTEKKIYCAPAVTAEIFELADIVSASDNTSSPTDVAFNGMDDKFI